MNENIVQYDVLSANAEANKMTWNNSLFRAKAVPLERYSIFDNMVDAVAYLDSGVAYDGQIVAVKEMEKTTWSTETPDLPAWEITSKTVDETTTWTLKINGGTYETVASAEALSVTFTNVDIGGEDPVDLTFTRSEGYTQNVYVIDSRSQTGLKKVNGVGSSSGGGGSSADLEAEIIRAKAAEQNLDTKIDTTKTALESSLSISVDDSSTTSGMLKSYKLTQGGQEVGVIDIPKDYLVKSAEVKTCATDDNPVEGYKVGDKYIDFTINVKEGTATDEHLYIALKDLMTPYTGSTSNTVEVSISSNNAIVAEVVDGTIAEAKLATDAVTSSKIKDGAVGTSKIENDAVTTDKIAEGAVGTDQLSAAAVTTAKIADGAVTSGKIANSAVTNDQLAADAVEAGNIKDGAVGTAKIADGAVTSGKIAADAVTETAILNGAVTTDKLGTKAVTTDKIADGNVSAEKLAANAVTTEKIKNSAVTLDKIAPAAIAAISGDALDEAKEYTDERVEDAISGLTAEVANDDASKTVDKIVETDGIVSATFKKIQIAEDQVTGLTDDIEFLISEISSVAEKLSDEFVTEDEFSAYQTTVGLDKASSANKVATLSDLTDSLTGLTGEITGGASQTITSIVEADGKITGAAADIAITHGQVTDWEDEVTKKIDDAADTAKAYIDGISTALSTDYVAKAAAAQAAGELSAQTVRDDLTAYVKYTDVKTEVTGTNKIVTEADIADIAGALHFRGAFDREEGKTDKEILAEKVSDPKNGDVALVGTAEYVYLKASESATGEWKEFGDEGNYVNKATYESFTADISGEVSSLEDRHDEETAALSTAIDNKIKIDDVSADTLGVKHVSQDEYHRLVVEGECLSNVVYIVSSDNYDMYGKRIVNLSTDGNVQSDAANVGFVKSTVDALRAELDGMMLSGVEINGVAAVNENGIAKFDISCICGGDSN